MTLNPSSSFVDTFVSSRDVPSFLVDFNSTPDLSNQQVDESTNSLQVKKLADLFGVDFFHLHNNTCSMKELYTLLVRRCILQGTMTMSKRTDTDDACTHQSTVAATTSQIEGFSAPANGTSTNEYRFPITGFVYAPTATAACKADEAPVMVAPNVERKTSIPESPPPYYLTTRRGSKDSW